METKKEEYEVRNEKYNEFGTIDCEINHPHYGWIPFTANPYDDEEHGRIIYANAVASGKAAPYVAPVIPQEQLLAPIKEERKQALRMQMVDELLKAELAAIDNATSVDEIAAVKVPTGITGKK